MRRILPFVACMLAALPLGAQVALLARFSESQWREPTFVVSQAAYVGVFELLDGGRIVQRFPRAEAQGFFALPAGETPLTYLDVNVGRVTEPPGSRTVFWNGGTYGTRPVASGGRPTARTLMLVASATPLRVGPSSEFPALARAALDSVDRALGSRERALAAVLAVVRPSGEADVASDVQTLWFVSYPEAHGMARSLAADDPVMYRGTCDVVSSASNACGTSLEHGGMPHDGYGSSYGSSYGGGWGWGWLPYYVPYFPTAMPRMAPTRPMTPVTVGVLPGQRVTPMGPQGGGPSRGVVQLPDGPVEQVPALRTVRWNGPIAGAGGAYPSPVAPTTMGGAPPAPVAPAIHAAPTFAPVFSIPSARPTGPVRSASPTYGGAPMTTPAAAPMARGPAPAAPAAHVSARPAPMPIRKQ